MAYTKQTWENLPSQTTPINADRLSHIEQGIYDAASTADTAASDASSAIGGLADKVDKIEGKGLSTNDFTDALKTKLDNIETGAEVNVQADYAQTDTTADDYIKNKPTLGTASAKNSTSVVTDSTDLVESGAVLDTLRDAEVVEGKNLLDWSKESQTINGITFTVNEDKSITANGTTTAGAAFILINSNSVYNREILGKSLKFTGCPQGGSESTYNLYLSTWGTTSAVTDYGSGAEINIPSSINGFRVDVAIKPNQTVSNLVFKPMLSLDGGEYEPYYTPLKDVVPTKADNSVIGTVENGTNPTKSYAVDEFMVRDGAFCQVTAPVTTSSTWTEGSNYTKKSIAEVLQSLMS